MNIFSNMKVGSRLIAGFLIIAALVGTVGVVAYFNMKIINDGMTSMYTNNTIPIEQLGMADAKVYKLRSDLFAGIVITSNRPNMEASINDDIKAIDEQMDNFRKNDLIQAEKDELAKFDSGWKAYQKMSQEIAQDAKNATMDKSVAILSDPVNIATRKSMDEALQNLIVLNQQAASEQSKRGDATFSSSSLIQIILTIVGLLLAMGLGIILSRSITNPLSEAVNFLNTIARGDISQDPSDKLLNRKDELGSLAQAMLKTTHYLRKNVQDISSSAHALSSSATELSAISQQTASSAKESAMKSNTVAAAAEEMSTNTVSVASGMEQATTNLSSVATAVEEMTSTIGEIAKNSEKARYTTEQTAQQVNQYAGMMRGLGQAAHEIGKFTETIASISAQTNLLALNATIEAARAGAAGKGFAVVANEIKELAQQTAAATGEIKNKINDIQTSAVNAVQDVEKIVHIIQEVNDSVSSTAAAIQEQATVTQDIAMNIAQASTGIKDANNRMAQTAVVSRSIAQDIAAVSTNATQITDASGQTQESAANLSMLAEQLNQLTSQFKV
jgi:methyl-accepting chemotaxis protein